MEVTRIIIHQISKEQGVIEAHLDLSENLIPIENEVTFLTEKLSKSFNKDERVIKINFLEDQDVFQKSLNIFLNNDTDDDFKEFSVKSINRLKDILLGVIFATGGYVIFIEYEINGTEFVSVFIVRDSKEVTLEKSDSNNEFIVQLTKIIKTENLAMAVRIETAKLLNGDDRYLHFTHVKGNTSEYFIKWIEADIVNKSKEDTRTFIGMLNHVDVPIDNLTGEKMEESTFRKRVHDYINTAGGVINLNDISKHFWGDEQKLSNYAEENNITIDMEFRSTKKVLDQLNKYTIESGKLKLSFTRKDYNQGIVKLGDNNQVIIEDEHLYSKFDELDLE
ncbi:nucleoid-associated protein [Marivirga sericea]|jgi:nucleoid-associated protein|uniref:Nucleoid-associated protein n=1 Tax=Marivirga sericea TaxID=1028 RepID=A0A1X7J5F6_9BACT|nr:nucleoid-associated protein [Marivirga sericea]SMG22630.1 nucleoid-associated protein [Marivirga sericea]